MYRVIFEHHPILGKEQEFINQWQAGSDIIQTYSGALGTLLFKSIDKPGVMYAMAERESKSARDEAIEAISKRDDAEWVMHEHEKYVDSYSVIVSAELIAESRKHD